MSAKLCPQSAVSCILQKYREEAEYWWAFLSEGGFTSKRTALSSALENGRIRECKMEESKPTPSFWCGEQHNSWLKRERDRGSNAGLTDPHGEAGTGCRKTADIVTMELDIYKTTRPCGNPPIHLGSVHLVSFEIFYLSKFLWTLFKTSKVSSPGPTWKLLSVWWSSSLWVYNSEENFIKVMNSELFLDYE